MILLKNFDELFKHSKTNIIKGSSIKNCLTLFKIKLITSTELLWTITSRIEFFKLEYIHFERIKLFSMETEKVETANCTLNYLRFKL